MFVQSLAQDIRIGLRVLLKERTFSALAITVLALGICGVTTQFSVVNGIMLRGFSFPEPQELVNIQFIDPTRPNPQGFFPSQTYALDFEAVAPHQQSFSIMAGYLAGATVNVSYNGNAQRYTGAYVTHEFARLLGVAPIVGRDFTAADNRPGAPKVALISHQLWERDFNRDPNIVGQAIRLNGTAASIAGVMPPNFNFPFNEQIWVPFFAEYPPVARNHPNVQFMNIIARLKRGVSIDQATTEMTGFAQSIAAEHPDTNRQFNAAQIRPLITTFVGPQLRQTLTGMLVAVGVVLLISCVNVMNMQFARATLRAREFSIRGALGAGRARLIRQMLTESLLVAVLGALLGVGLSYWAVDYLFSLTRTLAFPLPYWVTFDIDGPVLAATVGVTAGSAVVFGLVPAILASRANAAAVIKEGGRGNTSRVINRFTRGLVILQIGLTCLLLIGSTLQVKSIVKQSTLDWGYDETSLFTARLGLFEADYPGAVGKKEFYERYLRALRAHPEVEAAALTTRFRMTFTGQTPIEIDGEKYARPEDRPVVPTEFVSEDYFAALGLRVIEGRDFRADDLDAKQPVALVNASFAKRFFQQASPIGRRFRPVTATGQTGPWRTIVGVVPDTRLNNPFNPQTDNSGFFVPFFGNLVGPVSAGPAAQQFATVMVRPRSHHGESAAKLLREVTAKLDGNLPLYFAATPQTLHDEALGQNRIITGLFAAFGVVAVVLAAVGLYGVMSFSVNQRTQEFGIRMALGADAKRILEMVMRQGGLQLAIGLGLGLGATLLLVTLLGTTLTNLLFQVSPRDPLVYASVVMLIVSVAAVSMLVPARRAARVDPMVALRAE